MPAKKSAKTKKSSSAARPQTKAKNSSKQKTLAKKPAAKKKAKKSTAPGMAASSKNKQVDSTDPKPLTPILPPTPVAQPVVVIPKKRKPPLTSSQIKELEEILMSDMRRHQRSVAGLEETLISEREAPDVSGDMADSSGDVALLESATLLASHSSRALREILGALQRLRSEPEAFGICQVSGQPISYERLLIVPTARTTARHG